MASEFNLSGVFHLIRMTKRGQDQLSNSKLLNCALRRVLCDSLQACAELWIACSIAGCVLDLEELHDTSLVVHQGPALRA
jgi:hypothetical protein